MAIPVSVHFSDRRRQRGISAHESQLTRVLGKKTRRTRLFRACYPHGHVSRDSGDSLPCPFCMHPQNWRSGTKMRKLYEPVLPSGGAQILRNWSQAPLRLVGDRCRALAPLSQSTTYVLRFESEDATNIHKGKRPAFIIVPEPDLRFPCESSRAESVSGTFVGSSKGRPPARRASTRPHRGSQRFPVEARRTAQVTPCLRTALSYLR
jgi:hypothetical protein